MTSNSTHPIGIFDSGVGGLSALCAIRAQKFVAAARMYNLGQ